MPVAGHLTFHRKPGRPVGALPISPSEGRGGTGCTPACPIFTILRDTLVFVGANQNVTLSVPRDVLKRVKRLAADRDTSVSALMTEALARLADEDRRYSAARKRSLAAMKSDRLVSTRGLPKSTHHELLKQ